MPQRCLPLSPPSLRNNTRERPLRVAGFSLNNPNNTPTRRRSSPHSPTHFQLSSAHVRPDFFSSPLPSLTAQGGPPRCSRSDGEREQRRCGDAKFQQCTPNTSIRFPSSPRSSCALHQARACEGFLRLRSRPLHQRLL